jgi:hypothetical protein
MIAIANASPGPARGDVNGDSAVNIADIFSLMTGLSDLPKFQSTRGLTPSQLLSIADLNGDGQVANTDVQGLIVAIANSGAGAAAGTAASQSLQFAASPAVAPSGPPQPIPLSLSPSVPAASTPATSNSHSTRHEIAGQNKHKTAPHRPAKTASPWLESRATAIHPAPRQSQLQIAHTEASESLHPSAVDQVLSRLATLHKRHAQSEAGAGQSSLLEAIFALWRA